MKALLLFAVACAAPPPPAAPTAPPPDPTPDPAFEPLKPLLGTWEGEDPAHHTKGGYTMHAELAGKVLVRRSTNGTHEDLTLIYATPKGLRADYFDNEDHQFAYAITRDGDHIIFLSDAIDGAPQFRLAYELHGADEVAIDFGMKAPGAPDFQHYVGGTVHRIKQP